MRSRISASRPASSRRSTSSTCSTGFLQRPADDDDDAAGVRLARGARRGGVRAARPASSRSAISRSSFPGSSPTPSTASSWTSTTTSASAACAYDALSRYETDTFSPVFAELADKFVGFVDVLSEVSERASCSSNADLLRLYERWLKTGSRRSGQLLVERGVVPNASARPAASSSAAVIVMFDRRRLQHTSAIFCHSCRLRQRTIVRRLRSEPSVAVAASKRIIRFERSVDISASAVVNSL